MFVALGRDGLVLVPGELLDLPFQGAQIGATAAGAQPDPGTGLVHEVDGLVGQETVGQIAVGEFDGGEQRLVGVADLVMGLVAVPEAVQDGDGVRGGGLGDHDGLEAAGERGVLLDVLAVLPECGRAHHMQFAAGQRGLEEIARVHLAALGASAAGADDRVQLVDEDDQLVGVGADLIDDAGDPLLEVAAEAGAGHDARDVELDDPAAEQDVRHIGVGDPLGEPFDDGRLADSGLADEDGVVLAAPGEHLDALLDLLIAADHGVDPPLAGQFGQIAAEPVEVRGLPLVHDGPLVGRRSARREAAGLGRTGGPGLETGGAQDLPGGGLAVGGERDQYVLGADVRGAA
ncbi:hypothetical protein GCM10017744_014200 [Streptomyces antimycoticus]